MKQFSLAAAMVLGPILILIALFGIVKFTLISIDYHAGDMDLAAAFFTFLSFNVLIILARLGLSAWELAGEWLKK